MFRKVAVANRGEIAVRVFRTLREMEIRSVALYSDPDRAAVHTRTADEAVRLPGESSAETYLDIPKVVEAALQSGAEAVHPGYGFLSENADFAEAVQAAGLTFIGPPPGVIRAMGDKIEARRMMSSAGVPVVPGWSGDTEDAAVLRRAADEIGYPLLVKAAAGGGGRGMRRVEAPEELPGAIDSARAEAIDAFGDGRIFLERYLSRPRHVEFQVFGDRHGSLVHLFERECSIQRRHQKIVEESPSPALGPALRARMAEAALLAARTVGYENAGTVELILDGRGEFYFLEMNTRLQVEHPVTEWITGRDLVRAQLEVAAGGELPFRQEDLRQEGHALECRVYAEDPEHGFAPGSGRIEIYRQPSGPGVRVDSGFAAGSVVSVHYDSLLAKITTWAQTREQAIDRMSRALAETVILGVPTNLGFLQELVRHEAFRAGELHTHFLEEHRLSTGPARPPIEALAAAGLLLDDTKRSTNPATIQPGASDSPWRSAGAWRLE